MVVGPLPERDARRAGDAVGSDRLLARRDVLGVAHAELHGADRAMVRHGVVRRDRRTWAARAASTRADGAPGTTGVGGTLPRMRRPDQRRPRSMLHMRRGHPQGGRTRRSGYPAIDDAGLWG